MAAADVPHLVKHNTLAIWRDAKIGGGKRERFVSAWNIARSRLVEYGFLVKGSESGGSEDIRLTSKGAAREAFHAREPGGKTKSMLFDQMFRWIELGEEEKDDNTRDTNNATTSDRTALEQAETDAKNVSPLLDKEKDFNPSAPPKARFGTKFKVEGDGFDTKRRAPPALSGPFPSGAPKRPKPTGLFDKRRVPRAKKPNAQHITPKSNLRKPRPRKPPKK